jgi:hypothetical protein
MIAAMQTLPDGAFCKKHNEGKHEQEDHDARADLVPLF